MYCIKKHLSFKSESVSSKRLGGGESIAIFGVGGVQKAICSPLGQIDLAGPGVVDLQVGLVLNDRASYA